MEQLGEVSLARATRARLEVVLQVRVAASGVRDLLESSSGERRTAEVRVDDYARRVEHSPQARRVRGAQFRAEAFGEIAWLLARLYQFTCA